jgi:hypothetical protein
MSSSPSTTRIAVALTLDGSVLAAHMPAIIRHAIERRRASSGRDSMVDGQSRELDA